MPAHGGSVYSLIRMCMSKSDFVFNTRPLHDHTIFDLTNGSTEISSSIRVLLEYGDLCPGSSRAPPRLMAAAQSDSRFRMEKIMSASIWREYTALERRDETSDASVPRRRDGTRKRSNLGTMDRTTDKREARLRSVSKIWIKTSGNQIRKPRRLGSTLQIFDFSLRSVHPAAQRALDFCKASTTAAICMPSQLMRLVPPTRLPRRSLRAPPPPRASWSAAGRSWWRHAPLRPALHRQRSSAPSS